MLAQRVQRGKTPRLRFGRRREAVGRRQSEDQRRPGDRRKGKGNSARRQSGQRSGEENPAWRRRTRTKAGTNEVQGPCCGADGSDDARSLASVRKNRAQPTGTGAMRPMMPPWAGRRWRRRGRLFPGKHRSGEKIGRKQPEAPNSPRDNASAAFGDYRSLILGSLSLPPHTGMHSKSSQRVSRHVRTRVMIGMPKRRYRRRSTR